MRKLTSFLLLIITTSGWAQTELLSLQLENATAQEAIAQVMDQVPYQFAYNPDVLTDVTITGSFENLPFETAVDRIFADQYNVKIRGSYVILLPKKTKNPKTGKKKPIQIKGEIVEANTNRELENVTIYEVSTLKPVLTDSLGVYSLELDLPEEVAFVAISKENYEDTVIQVKKNEFWRISLRRKEKADEPKPVKVQQTFLGDKISTHAKNVNLTERRWFQLALTPGLSTNGFLTGQFTNRISINMLAGYSHAVEGVEIGGALNMSRSYVQGVQMAGAANINGELTNGVQFAGISNITLSDLKGWQAAGFSNHVNQASGVQTSGAINTSKNMKGVQVAGMINWNKYEYKGVQLSGGLNFTKLLKGVQIGVVNVADSVAGGFMIGVVNWAKNGFHVLEVSSSDVTPYNLAFKSGVQSFYTILRAGINPHSDQLWDYGMGFGSFQPLKTKAFLDFETTYHVIQPIDRRYIDGLNFEIRWQLRFGYALPNNVKLIAGPVLHWMVFKPSDPADLSFADRIGSNTLFGTQTSTLSRKGWLGYEFAIRF